MMVASIFLLLIVLLVCCFLPIFVIFHDRARALTFAHIWLYTAIGMGFLGVYGILCKFLGIDMRFSALPGVLIAIYGFKKYPLSYFIPQISFAGIKTVGAVCAIIASAISFAYIFITGVMMGTGSYPPVFFNVDTPYYLGQIHGLIRYDAWPPLSLSFLGGASGYHYGTQSVCAVISTLTGIAPHTAVFLVFMPLVQLAIISAVWLIVGNLKSNLNSSAHWWGISFLLFTTSYYPVYPVIYSIYKTLSQASLHWVVNSILSLAQDPLTFQQASYPMLSTHFGYLLAFGSIYCLQNYSSKVSRIFLALIVGIAIVFKSPIYVTLIFGFGSWTLYELLKTRRLSLLWPLILSIGVALCLNLIAKPGGDSSSWVFVPSQYFLENNERILDTIGTFLLYALPGLLLVIGWRKNNFIQKYSWMYPAAFIVPVLLFIKFFNLSIRGEFYSHIYQILTVMPAFIAMFSIALVFENWHKLSKLRQRAVITMMILIILLPFVHRGAYTGIIIFAPERGYQYAENYMAAEALANIPILNSVVVTNDFRYPLKNYHKVKDLRQMQLPALFGHQMYATNFKYERFDDSDRRLALQYRFRNDAWDPELENIAQEEGWTHLIIHRLSPYAENIPLHLIFENSEYRVYEF